MRTFSVMAVYINHRHTVTNIISLKHISHVSIQWSQTMLFNFNRTKKYKQRQIMKYPSYSNVV